MEVIAIANQKGGVGKTVTASALSAGLSLKGYRVLSIDLDSQRNFSFLLHIRGGNSPTILDVLVGDSAVDAAIQATGQGDAIAASPQLVAADFLIKGTKREYRLSNALDPLKKKYDFAVLDTPPALGTITVNALTAASSVVVPALADVFSVQGVLEFGETVRNVQQRSNPFLKHRGILLTRHNDRSVISRDMVDTLKEAAQRDGVKLFSTAIRDTVVIREAAASGTNIFSYAPKSKAAADYLAFIEELLRDIKQEGNGNNGSDKEEGF